MKVFISLLFFILAINTCLIAREKFDPVAWNPPYKLSLDGWGIERFPIPINFAPEIPYKGVEDVQRTALVWAKLNGVWENFRIPSL